MYRVVSQTAIRNSCGAGPREVESAIKLTLDETVAPDHSLKPYMLTSFVFLLLV